MKHFQPRVGPAYDASKVAEHLTPDENPDIKLSFKLVSAVGLGYLLTAN